MSKLSGGASYLNKESVPAKRLSTPKKSPVMVAVSAFFALLVLFISSQPLISSLSDNSPHKAEAGAIGLFCTSHIGLGMDDKSDWSQFLRVYPNPTERNRVWTLQEAFGSGLSFVNYEGEGGKDKDLIIEKSPANTAKPGNYDSVSEKLEGIRGISSCFTAGGLNYVANGIMGLANVQSNIVQAFVVFAFDSNIICSDAANPTGACLNLLKVIGGTGAAGNGGGLIGTLTSSIYMPLLVIAVTIVGLWVGYKGLVQRKLREAMFGAIWVCLSAIFGLALLLNPSLLAKAPMAVSNAVATCVIGSFNGQNCMDNSSGNSSLTTDNFSTSSDKICRSLAPGAALDAQMSMTVNSLSCSIWKAFVLEPYAQGSFGTSFGNLDTVANTPTKKVIEKAGLDPNTFCVNLGSSESLESFNGKRAVFDRDSGKVCNLIAYQMFLKTNASTTGSTTPASDAVDPRWYNVVVTAANDEGLWAQWAPSPTNSMHKIATSMLAGFTGLVGGIVLIVIAFFALVYYLTSVILMAFAPLFFLLGVHPGRGKKILLGWIEKVVSNVLKYLASAIFLIVSISFYAAILGAASSPALTFLFVIIVSGALIMYRKEIVDLIGKASMGGEQLSNSFSEKLKERAAGVGSMALAGAGSGLGAAIAGGRVSSGIKAGIQRDLQRGGATRILGKTGGELVSNATRQFARNTVDNERDVKEQARRTQAKLSSNEVELEEVRENTRQATDAVTNFDATYSVDKSALDELNTTRDAVNAIEHEAAREMMHDNSYFAQAQMIANQIAGLEFEKKIAIANGDQDAADRATADIQQLRGQRELLLGAIDGEELATNRKEYQSRVADKMERASLDYTDTDEQKRVNLSSMIGSAQATRDNLVSSANELIKHKNELEIETAGLREKEAMLDALATQIQPGDMVTKKKADAILAEGEKAYDNAVENFKQSATYIPNRTLDDVHFNPRLGPEDNGNPPSDGPSGPAGPTGGADRGPSTSTGPVTPSPKAPVGPSDPSPVAPTTPTAVIPEGNNAPTDRLPISSNSGNVSTPESSTRGQSTPASIPDVTSPANHGVGASSGLPTSRLSERLNTVSEMNDEAPVADVSQAEPRPRPTGIPTSQGRRAAATPVDSASIQSGGSSESASALPPRPSEAPTIHKQTVSETTASTFEERSTASAPRSAVRDSAPVSAPQQNSESRPQPRYEQPQTTAVAPSKEDNRSASVQTESSAPSIPAVAPQPSAQSGIPTSPSRAPQSAQVRAEPQQNGTPVAAQESRPVVAPTVEASRPVSSPERPVATAPRVSNETAPAKNKTNVSVAPTPAPTPAPTATVAPQPSAQSGIPTTHSQAPRSTQAPAPERPRSTPQSNNNPAAVPEKQPVASQPVEATRSSTRVEAPKVENVRPKPETAPTIQDRPAQPAQAPRVHEQSTPTVAPAPSRRESRVETPRTETPRSGSVSASTPPERAPRVPAQPSHAPKVTESRAPEVKAQEAKTEPTRLPVKPKSAPTIQERPVTPAPVDPVRMPTSATPTAPTPVPPAREPMAPRTPDRQPGAPKPNKKEERQAPLAREIKLPSAPRVSRVTENSDLPDFKIQKEDKSDNVSPTRGFGLPRRRNSKND